MLHKFASFIGSALVQSAITIGTFEICMFAANRAIDLITEKDQPVLTKLARKIGR